MHSGISSRCQSRPHAGIARIPSVLNTWWLLDFRYDKLESEIKEDEVVDPLSPLGGQLKEWRCAFLGLSGPTTRLSLLTVSRRLSVKDLPQHDLEDVHLGSLYETQIVELLPDWVGRQRDIHIQSQEIPPVLLTHEVRTSVI